MIYATFYFQGDTQWLRMNPQKIILKQYSSSANSVRLFGPWTLPNELGFKKSSVSVAMKNLREKNQITVTPEGFIYLTDAGREIAEMIYERHELLTEWLVRLGVDKEIAAKDACRMEHVISKESFEAIKNHIK